MATFDYVEIPADLVRLKSSAKDIEAHNARPASKIMTSLPHPELQASSSETPSGSSNITSPTKAAFTMLPQLLISSSLQIPSNTTPLVAPHNPHGQPQLLSTRDPLSIPITTVNFKRFVSKSGPIFWVQDRVEEIVMWRKGWKVTGVWMAAYAFLCYFPRLVLLVPHAILLGILLATYPSESKSSSSNGVPPAPPANAGEGTVDWQANIQAIQNLMGAVADLHDLILPFVPHLTHATPYTPLVLTFLLASFLSAIPVLPLVPLRPTFLVLGLVPFIFTHPFMLYRVFPLIVSLLHNKSHRARVLRIIDDDRLEDRHWRSELREVELFENERWNASSDGEAVAGSWGKSYLKSNERSAWTRAQDGWSGVKEDGSGEVSSNLTFSLALGWAFVETEDWRVDLEATWVVNVGSDDRGWVYTNDSWLDPSPIPLDTWKSVGMTRRRRWTRRIYYDPAIAT